MIKIAVQVRTTALTDLQTLIRYLENATSQPVLTEIVQRIGALTEFEHYYETAGRYLQNLNTIIVLVESSSSSCQHSSCLYHIESSLCRTPLRHAKLYPYALIFHSAKPSLRIVIATLNVMLLFQAHVTVIGMAAIFHTRFPELVRVALDTNAYLHTRKKY